jgi:hypothetical protein
MVVAACAGWPSICPERRSSRRRSSVDVEPARRATESRDGVWSGKASDSWSMAARGRRRRAARSTARSTTEAATKTPAHQSTAAVIPAGRGTSRTSTAVEAIDATIGSNRATSRTANAATGRGRHERPSAAASVQRRPPPVRRCTSSTSQLSAGEAGGLSPT